MQSVQQIGEAIAQARQALRLKQKTVAVQAGITPESLSRFERGHVAEFGARKLLAVLAVLGLELEFTQAGTSGSRASGTLDELRRERSA